MEQISLSLQLLKHFWQTAGDITSERFYHILVAFQKNIHSRQHATDARRPSQLTEQFPSGHRVHDSVSSNLREGPVFHDKLQSGYAGEKYSSTETMADSSAVMSSSSATELFSSLRDLPFDSFGSSFPISNIDIDDMDFAIDAFTIGQCNMLDEPEFITW